MKTAYYKYRPLYHIGAKGILEPHPFTQSIFEKAEIYYSAPKNFNDPFDCHLKLHVDDSTDAEWERYYDLLGIQYPDQRAIIEAIKSNKRWRTDPRLAEGIGKDKQREIYEESSVFCLSKKCNSIPMFSYYADSHRGISIEFRFSDLEVPCGFPFGDLSRPDTWYGRKVIFRDVEYPPAFPELNYHRVYGTDKIVRSLMFTKHHEWSHEEEFRIFRRKVTASSVQFERNLLTRVIFGCRSGDAEVNMVKGWLAGWPSDVVLSKAETATDQFELRIKDFETVKAI